eukprot:SM000068S20626  [mRNA]  locus=s68:506228:507434:+ [translate_table: standard]
MVGDGRCLFRAVVHGSCLRSGQPPPGEALQRQMADELRIKVRDDSRPSHPDVQALLLRSSQPRSPGLQPIFAELMSPACYCGPHRLLMNSSSGGRRPSGEEHDPHIPGHVRSFLAPHCAFILGGSMFLEGDFDAYVRNMRRPHAWGGEPELLMLSHILRVDLPLNLHLFSTCRCPFPVLALSSLMATHEDLCPNFPIVSALDC